MSKSEVDERKRHQSRQPLRCQKRRATEECLISSSTSFDSDVEIISSSTSLDSEVEIISSSSSLDSDVEIVTDEHRFVTDVRRQWPGDQDPACRPSKRAQIQNDESLAKKVQDEWGQPVFTCAVCMDDFKISDMFTIDCLSNHRICFADMRRHVESELRQKKIPTCPLCTASPHKITAIEVQQLFGKGTMLNDYLDLTTHNLLIQSEDVVACPTPDCKQFIVLADHVAQKQKVTCPTCRADFCSRCKDTYHYLTTCGEAAAVRRDWHAWLAGGERAARLGRERLAAAAAAERAAAEREAARRFEELQRDEAWKAAHCRACPHCGRPVQRVDGCASMVCGRDAADKGGGNVQAGCKKPFNWYTAAPYKSDTAAAPRRPAAAAAGGGGGGGEAVRHVVPGTAEPLRCDLCGGGVVGPRFRCIHCPGDFTVCVECEADAVPATHPPGHAFRVEFDQCEGPDAGGLGSG